MYLHGTSKINGDGHLEIGGCDVTKLKRQFGTPLYIVDEALVRERCAQYVHAFRESGIIFQVTYASKAFCTMAMCRLVEEEGLSLDVVSAGELYTALQAGFPAHRIHFHGNNKTSDELEMALDARIGCLIVDNFTELKLLQGICRRRNDTVSLLLRVTPDIEAPTHKYMSTGQSDSKFGFDMGNGTAFEAVRQVAEADHLELLGIHTHIGSQIFETEPFELAVERVAQFARQVKERLAISFHVVNVGGGFGIRYVEGDIPVCIEDYIEAITDAVKLYFAGIGESLPEIWIEPGRSIIGEAGTTLYTVGSVKTIPGVRKYVAVDGGMTDNPRPILYQSRYEVLLANRGNVEAAEVVSIAGKCCESGDMLIWDIALPSVQQGDLLAVPCTGAYNYSMASNYNRIPRPAVVFVRNGTADTVVRRESYEDIVRYDCIPARLSKK